MKPGKRKEVRIALGGPVKAFAATLAALSLAACGGSEAPNRPPTATLDPGFVQGDTVSYALSISWSGSDPDGRIVRFEYAIDPPPAFSEDEIAHGGPGITTQEIPAAGDAPAKTRVIKSTGGTAAYFDWVHTTDTSHDFAFSATQADSAGPDSARAPTGRFYGMHALYLRAVDNDGAVSDPDHVAFTAATIAPTERITSPASAARILYLGTAVRVTWEGDDQDGPAPTRFESKLVPIPTVQVTQLWTAPDPVPFIGSLDHGWSPGTGASVDFYLADLNYYVFAVRAIDEAGAADPFLEWGRNAFACVAGANHSPDITLNERYLGSRTFDGGGPLPSVHSRDGGEVPLGIPLNFTWSASAASYGGVVDAYSWGFDIVDLENDSHWSLWGQYRSAPTYTAPTMGGHSFSVRVRDTAGGITIGTVFFNVLELPFDREVLYVDDYPDKIYPRADQHEAFWQGLFQDYEGYAGWGSAGFDEIHVYGADDTESFDPPPLLLSQLGHYKLVIWNTLTTGVNGVSSLLKTATFRPALRFYLLAGGKLWVTGGASVAAMVPSPNGTYADFAYPLSPGPGSFAYDFMKLHTARIGNDKGASANNTLNSVSPYPGSSGEFDSMVVDTTKLNQVLIGLGRRVSFAEAVLDPLLAEQEPGFRGMVDSVYVYGAAGPELSGGSSFLQGKPCAIRWHDPSPNRAQGRVMWFGFPMYYFKDDQAKDTFRKAMDWFREETPGAPSP